MTDERQMERFREAVDEKNEAAKAASEQQGDQPTGRGDEPAPTEAELPQDEDDQRTKNSRHGQVTADKWNQ